MSLKFDGMGVMNGPPPDFKATSDQAIEDAAWFKVILVRKERLFFSGHIVLGGVKVERLPFSPAGYSCVMTETV